MEADRAGAEDSLASRKEREGKAKEGWCSDQSGTALDVYLSCGAKGLWTLENLYEDMDVDGCGCYDVRVVRDVEMRELVP